MASRLEWSHSGSDDPMDQDADSRHGGYSYWSLGPADDGRWSVDLISRDCDLVEDPTSGVDLGSFNSEMEAKSAAQEAENKGGFPVYDCEHGRATDSPSRRKDDMPPGNRFGSAT